MTRPQTEVLPKPKESSETMASFAYLFERFPSFTQTFCYREVAEMVRQGYAPAIYAIRRPDAIPVDCPEEIAASVVYLPEQPELKDEVKAACRKRLVKAEVVKAFKDWGKRGDKSRLYEAIWLGPILLSQNINHVHAHFSGIAARTAYWLKQFFGITYSITTHANDFFCEFDYPVTLNDLIREAELIVTVTDFSRNWLQARYPEAKSKIHRVYNGIDLAPFKAASPAPGRPRIVSVGRYIEKKGYEDLIDACAVLKAKGVDFECQIIGGGPREEALREQVGKLDLGGNVILTGPKPQEEVREILSQATLFVLACVVEADGGMDNFPTVIVEAMASSLPVVSTNVAGVPEMIKQARNGFLVNPNDPPALAEAMANLLDDPDLIHRFGAAGRSIVEKRFTAEVTVSELWNLLKRCPQVHAPAKRKSKLRSLLACLGG